VEEDQQKTGDSGGKDPETAIKKKYDTNRSKTLNGIFGASREN